MSNWRKRSTGTLDDAMNRPALDVPPNPTQAESPLPPPPARTVRLVAALRAETSHRPVRYVWFRQIRGGTSFRIVTPRGIALVRSDLAHVLEDVFERFARDHGYGPDNLLSIEIARGLEPTSAGHFEGRAADICAVGGLGFLEWADRWRAAVHDASHRSDPNSRERLLERERRRNLGFALYEALRNRGGWRVNEGGWRPYRGAAQLFGPWTPILGPWKRIRNEKPDATDRQRMADQAWVFHAHRDHIHVAM